jgi:hypothetical protein
VPYLACEKLQKIRGKIENVGAPTFLGVVYPPVFAYVWERKELPTRGAYVGETLGLRRKWKIEIGKWEESRAERRKWKFENGRWGEWRNVFNA